MPTKYLTLESISVIVAFVALVLVLVFGENLGYAVTIGIFIGITAIAALGQNVISGYARQVVLGYSALIGISSYTAAILTTRMNFSLWLVLPIATMIVMAVGLFLGWLAIRVSEGYLAIVTIGFTILVFTIFQWSPYFGMSTGIPNIPSLSIFGFKSLPSIFFLTWAAIVILALFDVRLMRSRLGLGLRAIGQNQLTAESAGIQSFKYKLIALMIGSSYAGPAGVFTAYYYGYVHASFFDLTYSFNLFTMPILGGIGTTLGPILGAFLYGILPEISREVAQYRWLIFSAIVILVILFQPQGLLGRNSLIRRTAERAYRRFLHGVGNNS